MHPKGTSIRYLEGKKFRNNTQVVTRFVYQENQNKKRRLTKLTNKNENSEKRKIISNVNKCEKNKCLVCDKLFSIDKLCIDIFMFVDIKDLIIIVDYAKIFQNYYHFHIY